ncbi:hypothetical protein B1C78_04730 [Thioalkalivibrio denitrificans]|uniref:Uncharacterized protein n=1 Tax=Thioalkalivibrio denitrificans TaxID=108003 RepID=A0A1V3NNM7_9GAMM|nr:hypothetical protein [Thioalkalivibrio denitrificans]OOG26468.1 hypothetical protein B1C78_04730 [Thioalkalivibrio denitrificans]
MLTDREKRDARIVLAYFFGQEAADWPVNDRVIEKLGEMLMRENTCSAAMNLVPRPGLVDKDYIKRQLSGIARRILAGDHAYHICKQAVSYGWKRRIQLASQGL